MYCCKCGIQLDGAANFCLNCGAATGKGQFRPGVRNIRLSRPVYDKKIAGVCAGFARYLDVDVTVVRVVWILLAVWPIPFSAVLAYFVAWIVMPRDPLALPEPVIVKS